VVGADQAQRRLRGTGHLRVLAQKEVLWRADRCVRHRGKSSSAGVQGPVWAIFIFLALRILLS